ncbi:MAG: sugar phosphate nucleotidyltransferase [Bacteroidales bacterium]|nr:sugar phosphate nucleotidyltransferase [Bacteroidales bacterium]MCM1414510.1 sugar phosphate nucleotidyltransferase [bacterium]MCM1422561.1 sugar phosphate nucleotidyltransferase [bacterium]
MKVVILAGGTRSSISNEQEGIPKPMAEIGGKPLLWHIMKSFSDYGYNEFIICGGYKVNMIKEYFMDYYIYQSDITVDLQNNKIEIHKNRTEDWKVTVVDTGLYCATGQRVAQIQNYIEEENFVVTYGDCLSDIDVSKMYDYHINQGRMATMAVARPTGRNKPLEISGEGFVIGRRHSAEADLAWTNACLFILNKKVFSILNGSYELESFLISNLADEKQIATYKHKGFWTPVETNRDRVSMENLWNAGVAPWMKTIKSSNE